MRRSGKDVAATSRLGLQERRTSEDVSQQQSDPKPAMLPAVLVPPSSEEEMTELQATERKKIEETFVADIGGPDQNPSDPEYLERWQSAQEISDDMFRLKFGIEAFLAYNTEAGRRNE